MAELGVSPKDMWHREHATYSYEFLWQAALSALRMAEIEDPRRREDHLALHSLLSGFLALEGFKNLVGEEIAPEIWIQEREFFSQGCFRGIVGKVEYLFTRFPGAQLRKGENPYQTFSKVKRIRDCLVHNKVFRYGETSESELPDFRTYWDDFDSPAKVRPVLKQLKTFAEMIRVEALKVLNEEYKLSHLHYPAFEGPLANAEGSKIG